MKNKPIAVMTGTLLTAILIGIGGGVANTSTVSAASNRTAPTLVSPTIKDVYVLKETANVRSTASLQGEVIEWAPKGSVVESLGETKHFVKIKQDGKVGYVSKKILKAVGSSEAKKAKYAYQTSQLSGYKKTGAGTYVASYKNTPLVTIQYHNENPDIATLKINYQKLYVLSQNDPESKSITFIEKQVRVFIESVYGKGSPDYKTFDKKLNEMDFAENKTYRFVSGDKKVMLNQEELPYSLELSILPTSSSLQLNPKNWYKTIAKTKLMDSVQSVQSSKPSKVLEKDSFVLVVGETKDFYYVLDKGRYSYVQKSQLTTNPVERAVSSKTASRSAMNQSFGTLMQKKTENRYEKVLNGKKMAIVEFSNAVSQKPTLKLNIDALILLPYSKYDEKQVRRTGNDIPMVTVDKDGKVTNTSGGETRPLNDWRDYLSKEDILKGKALKKELDPILKAYAESLFGKGTAEAKKFQSLFYDEDYMLYMTVNGQNLMSPTLESDDYYAKIYFK